MVRIPDPVPAHRPDPRFPLLLPVPVSVSVPVRVSVHRSLVWIARVGERIWAG